MRVRRASHAARHLSLRATTSAVHAGGLKAATLVKNLLICPCVNARLFRGQGFASDRTKGTRTKDVSCVRLL